MADATSQTMKVHQAVARALADNGVSTMFGLVGDANLFMVDSFVRECGGVFVAAANEAGSAYMALGYALMTGSAGVCSVTHGPAMTNTVTALVEAVKGSAPLVLFCGDTPVEDRENNQNVAQRDIIMATGAGFEQLRSPNHVAEDVARALRRAVAEHRPIALNLPVEFDWRDTEYRPIRVRMPESRAVVHQSEDMDNAVGIIAAAKRPVIVAGRGAVSADAKASILKLAARIGAPVATTLKAKDLFRGEPNNLGICGTVSSSNTTDIMMQSDCLISFGASLTYRTTSHGAFTKAKRVVQINQEPSEIGKNFAPHAGLVGDPGGTAEIILNWLDEAEIPSSGWCSADMLHSVASQKPVLSGNVDYPNGTVDFRHALLRLNESLPPDRVLVTDGGRFMRNPWQLIDTDGPDSFLSTVNFSSIGLGLSHGIGAAFARPGRPIVVVTGDGGFMHGGLTEFNTAVRYNLDLIVIVCNDGAYGAEVTKFDSKVPGRRPDSGLIVFDWPNFAPLANAFGGTGVTVRSEADLSLAEDTIRARSGPVLIDLKIDPDRMPIV